MSLNDSIEWFFKRFFKYGVLHSILSQDPSIRKTKQKKVFEKEILSKYI